MKRFRPRTVPVTTTRPLNAETRSLLLRFWRDWMWPYRWRAAVSTAMMGLVALVTGAYPLVINWSFDILSSGESELIYLLPIAIIGVTALRGLVLYIQTVFTTNTVLMMLQNLQRAVFRHLIHSDLQRLQKESPGAAASRVTSDVRALRASITRTITTSIRDILTVISVVISMFFLDWVLAFIVLCIYPFASIPIVRVGKLLRRNALSFQAGEGSLASQLIESLSSLRMVKAYRLESYEIERTDVSIKRMKKRSLQATRIKASLEPLLELFGGFAVAAVVLFAALRISSGAATVGDFTGFVAALLIASQPVRGIGQLNASLQEALASIERLFEVLDEAPRIVDDPTAEPLRAVRGELLFERVRFGYVLNKPVLHDFSLHVGAGETVALVGRSGGGKSTVFNLIERFYDVEDGRILIDGRDLRGVTIASLRDHIAYVGQDTVLYDDTVRANIGFGRAGSDEAAIVAAAKAAAAHDFIMALPDGYDTRIGDRGGTLSGGQRQRLALARAFLRDAPILLLDEATSALDTESEALVQEAIRRLAKDRTTLIIAHRLSTVRMAHRICVLEDGRLIEQGTHDELLRLGGRYATLHAIQFRTAEAAAE